MTYRTLSLALLAAALLGAAAAPAHAQRVFVGAQGSDGNPCSFAAPCRTFQHAHDAVAAGGEIDVLDPAGYGGLTITKAISIQGHGFAGVSVAAGHDGITVNAAATDSVNLNGLLIEGSGVGVNGIRFNSGRSLVVESCLVRNMTTSGLVFFSSALTAQTLSVAKSYFTENGLEGILISALGAGPITAAIDRSAFQANAVGVNVMGNNGGGAINVAATDSVANNNTGGTGFFVQSATNHSIATLVLTRVAAVGNNIGIRANGPNAIMRISQVSATGNTTGYAAANGGVIFSYGDNYIDGNGGNSGLLSTASKQ
jgi:hypothetical protein